VKPPGEARQSHPTPEGPVWVLFEGRERPVRIAVPEGLMVIGGEEHAEAWEDTGLL